MTLHSASSPHTEKHFTDSEAVRDIVIGMSDGLTVPFALAAGLSGAVDSSGIILTAGLAEVAAGAIAMGLGGYMAGRTDIEHYASARAREERGDLLGGRDLLETTTNRLRKRAWAGSARSRPYLEPPYFRSTH
jgi:VIT1/CCC1 family predicted Fe2+/Mn2+ transporter